MLRSLVVFLLSLAITSTAPAQPTPTDPANWSGNVELPGGLTLDFSVSLTDNAGTISIPMQGVKDMPLQQVSVTPKQLKFAIERVNAFWELDIADNGQTATGVLKQGGTFKSSVKRLAAGELPATANRPQEPKPPFPYEAEEVTFDNAAAAGVTLAGTLTRPTGTGPFPSVVLVTGSGAQDRDETLLGHKPFLVLADHLTRHGIAVLRYDDRGTAKSTGNFADATSDDFASDALAAVAFLKTRPEINPIRIGVVGHSEGGLVAPICAAQSKDVAFIVLLAGTGITGGELLPIQSRLIMLAGGESVEKAAKTAADVAELFAMVLAGKPEPEIIDAIRLKLLEDLRTAPDTKDKPAEQLETQAKEAAEGQAKVVLSPWFKRFLALDPRDNLRKVTCPVLAVNGEKDTQVSPKENLTEIEKALRAGGNNDVTIIEFPNLNHLFQTCETGAPSEYSKIEETFAPVALEAITRWIRTRTGLER